MEAIATQNRALLEDFLVHIASVRLLSAESVKAYRTDLLQLEAFFSARGQSLTDLSYDDGRRYMAHIMNLGFKSATLDRKLAASRAFYRHLYRNDLVTVNPFSRIRSLSSKRRLPDILTLEEVNLLLGIEGVDFNSSRDTLLFHLFYSTGGRLAEILALNLNDLDLSERRLLLRGKGDKERYGFLSEQTLEKLRDYLPRRQQWIEMHRLSGCNEQALLLNQKGLRLSASSVHGIFRKYQVKLGFTKRFTPHVLRHSFATHLLDNDSGIRMVQELLGHASISTTQIYTQVSNERLKRVLKECHPHGGR